MDKGDLPPGGVDRSRSSEIQWGRKTDTYRVGEGRVGFGGWVGALKKGVSEGRLLWVVKSRCVEGPVMTRCGRTRIT